MDLVDYDGCRNVDRDAISGQPGACKYQLSDNAWTMAFARTELEAVKVHILDMSQRVQAADQC